MLPPEDLTWDLAEPSLLALAAADLDDGLTPEPTLLAFADDEALGVAGLRPFGPGEALGPIIELLALLVPIGANRLALSVSANAWSLDGPADDQRVIAVMTVDGHGVGPAIVSSTLHPYEVYDVGWRWGEPICPPAPPEGEVPAALATILDRRDEVVLRDRHHLELPAQLGRILLLGHRLALAPAAAAQLEVATGTPPAWP